MIYDILPVNNYEGNNTATTFDFDFYIESPDELKVYYIAQNGAKTLLTYDVDYSINELRNTEGSYITFPIAGSNHETLKDTEKLSLQLYLPLSQETQYNNSSLLNLSALEHSFDYLTRLIQIVSRKIELCIKLDEGSGFNSDEILNNLTVVSSEIASYADEIEDMYDSVSQAYNEISSAVTDIGNMQSSIETLTTSKLNVSGDNFPASFKAIDGQWVFFATPRQVILDSTTTNLQQFDITTLLPESNYNYEIMLQGEFYHNIATGNRIYLYSSFVNNFQTPVTFLYSSTSAEYQNTSWIFPVGADRRIGFKAQKANFDSCSINIVAYRRIGTNA